jgi:PKD repeat protein
MSKKILVLVFLTALIAWGGCKKDDDNNGEVKADFTYQITSNPGEVVFTNRSANAQIYSWDFGDGRQSTQKDPVHIYDENDDFVVKLTATGSAGSNSVTDTIQVNNIKK